MLTPSDSGDWRNGPLADGSQAADGLVVYRFGASLYYANAGGFAAEVRDLVGKAASPVRWFCLDAGNIEDLDFSGSAVLKATIEAMHKQSVTFALCDVQEPVMEGLARRDGLLEIIGEEHVFDAAGCDMLRAYRALPPDTGAKVAQ